MADQCQANASLGELLMAIIAPHPPIMVPEVGRGEDQKVEATKRAMYRIGQEVVSAGPDTLIFITPHAPVFQDGIAILGTPSLQGNLRQFGDNRTAFDYPNDLELAQAIFEEAADAGIITALLDEGQADEFEVSVRLDHGVQVPLYFLQAEGIRSAIGDDAVNRGAGSENEVGSGNKIPVPVKLVVMAYGLLPFEELYAFGMAINRAIQRTGRRVVLIASSDLSHRLTREAPSGYRPEGRVFDQRICEITAQADVAALLNLPPGLAEQAGECGLRSMIIGWGAVDGHQVNPEVYSYEGPFGVGYLVANLGIGKQDSSRQLLKQLREQRLQIVKSKRQRESALVRLARESLETYLLRGKLISIPATEMKEEWLSPAGTFVSIKKHGQLRGCIGTIAPTQPNLALEIIENAVSAGIRDPRFSPVEEDELDDLVYSVDVLSAPEPIDSMAELDPSRFGVIVSQGSRRGLLLPNLEGIETVEEQVNIACQKAGIKPGGALMLERFEVKRYT
jgi:AmmeMemoRadiSam system protein A